MRGIRTCLVVQWLRIGLANSGSIPGLGTKIPHAEQQGATATTREPARHEGRSHMRQLRPNAVKR